MAAGVTSIIPSFSCFKEFVPYGESSVSILPTVLQEGKTVPLKVILFERYPEGYRSNSYRNDYDVPNSVITIDDPASGYNSPRSFSYNTTQH